MSDLVAAVALVSIAYAVGSIPFPLLVGRLKGIDVRREGTGNVGAGNLTRLAGWRAGLGAATLDVSKGFFPFVLGPPMGAGTGIVATAGLAAVAGHNWSIYLRSRSGRGLATSVGVLLGLGPSLVLWPAAWSIAGWRIGGSLAGFLGWGLLPVYAALAGFSSAAVTAATGLALLMMVRRAQGQADDARGVRAAVRRIVFDRDGLEFPEAASPQPDIGRSDVV